ncbi:MAG: hypothetical protein JXA03_01870 [Bacteroidales bacterium]|nr:hypothetical protein [Bacteroidales bacterium]
MMKQLSIFFIFLTLLPLCAASQMSACKPDKYWIDVGVGYYEPTNVGQNGFSYGISVDLKQKNTFYGVRFISHEEFQTLVLPDEIWDKERFFETGILIGKGLSCKWAQLRMSGGLGFIAGQKKGAYSHTVEYPATGWFSVASGVDYYDSERFFTPAIPLEFDVQLIPIPIAGLGCALYANLNLKRPLVGFMVRFSMGKLR